MHKKSWSLTLTALLLLLTARAGVAQEASDDAAETSDAKHAAQATIEGYVEAFNAGNAEGMAAAWTENGVFTNKSTGEQISGREALAAEFKALIESNEDRKLAIDMADVQLISPSVATQQGMLSITGGESTIETGFNVVYVDVDGKWLIDRVTEEHLIEAPSHYEQLKVLEWMIGDWMDESSDGQVTTSCQWTKNNNYILRTFSSDHGGDTFTGMQLIGWDPAEERIRSWSFDSDGGFAEGSWTQKESAWIVTIKAVLPGGGKAWMTIDSRGNV